MQHFNVIYTVPGTPMLNSIEWLWHPVKVKFRKRLALIEKEDWSQATFDTQLLAAAKEVDPAAA